MSASPRRAAVPLFREVIAGYRAEHPALDQHANDLLGRLRQSDDATKAFKQLMLGAADFDRVLARGPPYPKKWCISPPRCNFTKEQKAAELLTICIGAEELARTFQREITKAQAILTRADKLAKDVTKLHAKNAADFHARLRKFIDDIAKSYALGAQTLAGGREQASLPHDSPPVSIFERPAIALHSVNPQLDLDAINRWLDWGKGVASADLARLGVSRKDIAETAKEGAAIWWLGAQVRTVVGRPHWEEVAQLASVILKKDELSWTRVRGVVRRRSTLYSQMIGEQTARHLHQKVLKARGPH